MFKHMCGADRYLALNGVCFFQARAVIKKKKRGVGKKSMLTK